MFGDDGSIRRLPLADVLTAVMAAELFTSAQVGRAALVRLGVEQRETAGVWAFTWCWKG